MILLIVFIFSPLETVRLVFSFVVVVVVIAFMQTNNVSAALNAWLAFNVIYPSHSTGKQRFLSLLSIMKQ